MISRIEISIEFLISKIKVFTSNNCISDRICEIGISTSKKSIQLDINNWFWMAAYDDISLNTIVDIKNSYPGYE